MRPPAPLISHPINTVKELADHLQMALTIELATIPPYLCALYSISDPASEPSRLIRGVVIEEMLHMMQVANLRTRSARYRRWTRRPSPSIPPSCRCMRRAGRSSSSSRSHPRSRGEGAMVPQPPVPYEEPYGGYDHYGARTPSRTWTTTPTTTAGGTTPPAGP